METPGHFSAEINTEALLAWLEARDLPNTASTRLQYVEERARRAGSETSGVGVAVEHGLLPADEELSTKGQ
ncbi:hypothetical protein BOSEA1005_10334 [Hyphomicrobiales bacterium]|nr:hypothetical protein BOSEA1005_10334 [Hyphomicrobiales bacterium]CAI0343804.1 hypothetical protein BO1005MUT1_20006 [Hyphomicrobiales bacterium]